jgi:hypothetical protein
VERIIEELKKPEPQLPPAPVKLDRQVVAKIPDKIIVQPQANFKV